MRRHAFWRRVGLAIATLAVTKLALPASAVAQDERIPLSRSFSECRDDRASDGDLDGFSDACEFAVASSVAPRLVFTVGDFASRSTYWSVSAEAGTARVFFALGYLRDQGTPALLGQTAHLGDSEFIVVDIEEVEPRSVRITSIFLSAHYGALTDSSAWHDRGEFQFTSDGRPIIWVALSKHSNYASRDACKNGAFGFDQCRDVSAESDVLVIESRNLGTRRTQLVDQVDKTADGLPCSQTDACNSEWYWTDTVFCGWQVPASQPRDSCVPPANSYSRQLQDFGFVDEPPVAPPSEDGGQSGAGVGGAGASGGMMEVADCDLDHDACFATCRLAAQCCGIEGNRCCATGEACLFGGVCRDEVCSLPEEGCPSGDGLYCGDGELGRNQNRLYSCVDGEYTELDDCDGQGCKHNPAGENDECNVPTPRCGDDACSTETGESCQSCEDCCLRAPSITMPSSNGAVFDDSASIRLAWSAVSEAHRYQIKLCSDAVLSDCVTCSANDCADCINSTSGRCEFEIGVRDVTLPNPGEGTWYIQAQAIPSDKDWGWGNWSAVRTFTVVETPTGTGGTGGTAGSSGTGGAAGASGMSGGCSLGTCTPGITACGPDAGKVYICPSSGCLDDTTATSNCSSGLLCTPVSGTCQTACGGTGQPCCASNSLSTCTVGSCSAGTCSVGCPGTADCTGRVCGPDPICSSSCGSCGGDQACTASGQCAALTCSRGAIYCAGLERRQCAADGLSSAFIETCDFACSGGGCQPECTTDASCSIAEHCSADECVDDFCSQGEPFCSDQDVWQCNENGSNAAFGIPCPFGCEAGTCKAQCEDDLGCAPAQYCADGACQQDVCPEGQEFCRSETERSFCNANGSDFMDIQTCGYGCELATGACADCPADCTGKCGGADDGCGNACDGCGPNQICEDQICVGDPCSPDPCNGQGACENGVCTCVEPFAGSQCASCAPGSANDYPVCTPLCSLGTEHTIASGGFGYSALAWSGSGYALGFQQANNSFALLNETGTTLSSAVQTGQSNDYIGVAWSPGASRYGMAWGSAFTAQFQCVSAEGVLEGAVINLCGAGSTYCSAVSIGSNDLSHFGIVWADNRTGDMRIWFNRVHAGSCELAGPDAQVSTIWGRNPVVAFSNLVYGVAWIDQGGGLWLTRLDQFGVKIDDLYVAATHSGATRTAIASIGTSAEWAVVWNDNPGGLGLEQIYFQRASESAGLVGAPIRLTDSGGSQRYVRIASASDHYGLFWLDSTTASSFFQRFDRFGQPASPKLAISGFVIGNVGSDGQDFLTVYQPGRTRLVTCE